MYNLHIDIETYSSVDLKKSGMFKYVESPDFEILLFAYSLNGLPVEIIDFTAGEKLPRWLAEMLINDACIKHAYNAMFEWCCLSKFFGTLPIEQWRCTMFHGLYCGYTIGLEATGNALGLPQNKQKMNSGKALIRYFCVPCKPSKVNGGRTRNLPQHAPDRWNLFKEYCKQDVVTEMTIESKLAAFPVPDSIQREWFTDVRINSRGVAVDMSLVKSALVMGYELRENLMNEATRISGVNNPNSVKQLKAWLETEVGEDIANLNKETVSALLKQKYNLGAVNRMLEIRQELGKTSTKKYDAVEATVCADGRIRGLLQFYGANRTGRWAGRLVQVQNLPRTFIEPLAFARELVINNQPGALRFVYGGVNDTLSQLIRTVFVAPAGRILVDADFSAIEARVIAWLSGEQWRLEVFKTHGKIYEASAAQIFGVPIVRIVKGNPEYELRQQGKVAELALGYGMGAKKFKDTAEKQGVSFTLGESQSIVKKWRDASSRIRDLWYSVKNAAIKVAGDGGSVNIGRHLTISREFDYSSGIDCMTILLPSGRKLFYVSPRIRENQFGKPAVAYKGMCQTTKKWTEIDTYGGKLVENIVQAIARDCLAYAVEQLTAAGHRIVFHVHDEVLIESETDTLGEVTKIMSIPPPWAPGLPLSADGWTGEFFRKD
jgi:DNA polymerase